MYRYTFTYNNNYDCDCGGVREVKLFGIYFRLGAWGSVVVKALLYYLDGPGIDSRWCHWLFQ
jgi:hypothetical protein